MKKNIKKLFALLLGLLLLQGMNAQKLVVPAIPGEIEKTEYANYTQDAMKCINWLKNNSPNHAQRKDASAFVVWWLSFEGEGFVAAANGDAACLDSFVQPQMHAFSGQCTFILKKGWKGEFKMKE